MNILLIVVFALLFPLVHLFNGWLFHFTEITPHIALVYLPAFLRLAHVLILGRWSGTLATLLASFALMLYLGADGFSAVVNSLCSAGGPLVALYFFQWHWQREVQLNSLKDLIWLTLIYAVANSVLHHVVWSLVDPSQLHQPDQVIWMVVGDLVGTLMGALLLRWSVLRYRSYKLLQELE